MKKEVRLRLTTTKLQKASDCKRRLILEEVFGFPEPRNPAFLFGSVTHAVLERWFKTRGTGIVPYHSDTWENGGPFYGQKIGAKVDLFPPGWESNMDRDGTRSSIGPEEIPRVMGAIEAAFEAGYMDPIFDEVVEDKFTMLVIPGVTMTSLSDAYSIVGLRVLDHKTVAAQKYMKTPEDLSQNLQMAVFAKHFLDQYKKRYPHQEGPPWVDLVHNGLGKYPSSATGRHQAYRTSVRVTVATIEDNWKKIQRIAEESLSVVDEVSRSGWSEDDWQKIPGAKNTGICEKYDGCPLYDICHRGIAPSTVRKRIESQRRGSVPLQQSTMVISYTPPVAAQAPPIMQPQAAPAPPPPTVSSWPRLVSPTDHPENVWQTGPMPWASPQCPICRGAGTVKLKPCPACIENHDGEPVLELVRGQDGTPWLFFQGNKVTTDPNPQPSQAPQASQEPQDESDGEQEVQFGSKPKAKRGRKPKAEAAPVLEVALVPDPTPVPAQAQVQVPVPAQAQVQVPVPAQAQVQVPVPAQAQVQVPVPAQAQVQVPVPKAVPTQASKPLSVPPPVNCHLYIRSRVTGRGVQTHALEPYLDAAKSFVASQFQVSDFSSILDTNGNPWMRRDRLTSLASWVMEQIDGKLVTFDATDDPETRGIMATIEARCATVTRGVN